MYEALCAGWAALGRAEPVSALRERTSFLEEESLVIRKCDARHVAGGFLAQAGLCGGMARVGEGAEEKLSDAQGPSRRPACTRPADPGAWGGAEATGDD